VMGESPASVDCRGSAHITPGVEDVTLMHLAFTKNRSAIVHSSWLDPRKIREMTIVGSKRMIVYDDVSPLEKIRIFDSRVDCPPHYDTFAEFQYAYHYGDVYSPHIKQEEPLKTECQHFLDCIQTGATPLTDGTRGLEVVRILEASSQSLKQSGGLVNLADGRLGRGLSPNAAPGNGAHGNGANGGHGHGNGNGGNGHGNGNGNGKHEEGVLRGSKKQESHSRLECKAAP